MIEANLKRIFAACSLPGLYHIGRHRLHASLLIAMICTVGSWTKSEASPLSPPDVVLILVDDLNDWVGCLGGHPGVRTPNIDRLASRGMLFRNAHCAAPVCHPSRVSFLWGKRPTRTGIYRNGQDALKVDEIRHSLSLPAYFKVHGYETVGAGKVFHDGKGARTFWNGFGPHPDYEGQLGWGGGIPPKDRLPLHGIEGLHKRFDWGPVDVDMESYLDWRIAQYAVQQLSRARKGPLFLVCGFFRPHIPLYVPTDFFRPYPLDQVVLPKVSPMDLEDVPETARALVNPKAHSRITKAGQWKRAVQAYLASITFVDSCIGKVLDAIEKSPRASQTLIVLASDHGFHLGEKGHWQKRTLWEESTRVPLIFSGPGIVQGDCDRPVSLLDLYPTLVDMSDRPFKDDLDGVSLRPLLEDPNAKWNRAVLTTHGRGHHAVRSEHWRYIRYADGTDELYDHRKDPIESENLANQARFKDVKASLARWIPTFEAPEVR